MSPNEAIGVRFPQKLKAKLVAESESRKVSLQTIIIERLSKSFRIKAELPKEGWTPGRSRKAVSE